MTYQIKKVDKFPAYEVDSNGDVWTYWERGGYGNWWVVGSTKRKMVPHFSRDRWRLALQNNGIIRKVFLHRLIAETFLLNPNNKPQVNHKNGDPKDNRIENLYWGTQKENMADRYRHAPGTMWAACRGEKQWSAKLNYRKACLARLLKESFGWQAKKIAALFGVTDSTMCYLLKRKTWKRP